MKKIKFLFFITPLFLVACIRPPVPDVEQAIQNADPNTIIRLSNEATDGHFKTALPLAPSPTRGLVQSIPHITRNRIDIEQAESSMVRIAADFFDPDHYVFREGQHLSRGFVISILALNDPEDEDNIGLNPPLESLHTFDGTEIESVETNPVRPLIYILEQNFGIMSENEFQLEGAAIAIALNPYHWVRDPDIAFEHEYRLSDGEIIAIGQEIAEDLLPLIRDQEGLEDVPIILALFILQSYREVLPGGFASIAYIEEGRSSINSWDTVHERHFRLPDLAINVYDVNINEEFNAFSDTINNYFPHRYGLTARAHVLDEHVYRISIDFNMSFLGLSEKISFHQLLQQEVMNFSPAYDIHIIIRSPGTIHGSVTRPPNGEAFIHRVGW